MTNRPDFSGALDELKNAYALSSDFKTLLNIKEVESIDDVFPKNAGLDVAGTYSLWEESEKLWDTCFSVSSSLNEASNGMFAREIAQSLLCVQELMRTYSDDFQPIVAGVAFAAIKYARAFLKSLAPVATPGMPVLVVRAPFDSSLDNGGSLLVHLEQQAVYATLEGRYTFSFMPNTYTRENFKDSLSNDRYFLLEKEYSPATCEVIVQLMEDGIFFSDALATAEALQAY